MTEAVRSRNSSEISATADFTGIRYAQVWEDADVLLKALRVAPGETCLSIASAGDNALALIAQNPSKVVALDLSQAQIACLELRVAAFRTLQHSELLTLVGSTEGPRRELYRRCRPVLGDWTRDFWDARPTEVEAGIGTAGRFERYFTLFRTRILPLIHSSRQVDRLLIGGPKAERERFYRERWDTWRWRLLFRLFFSRIAMGRLGRDPSFFRYVEGTVADRILARTRHALTELDPAANPYLQWILKGTHTTALPYALRPENFEAIRTNLDRLEWRCASVESYLDEIGPGQIDVFNLSDIFEYMSADNYEALLDRLILAGREGGRLAYWNMLAPRRRPATLAARLRPLDDLAQKLHAEDKAFFYSAFVLEEIL